MNRTIIPIFIAIALSGCDSITHTRIKVSASATDDRNPEQISNEVLSAVGDTTAQFGFSEFKDDNSRLYTSGKDTEVWVEVFPDGHLDEIEIYEMFTNRPSELHRNFAKATVVALRTRRLDAKVFYQPPDSSEWICLLVFLVLLAGAVLFVWKVRQNRQSFTAPTQ
ncbi:MAG: hypothetical protein SFV81_01520 [Pirellulaceae bacterium]|nr:hypothetical protein [Pirellulaceae bacterium]